MRSNAGGQKLELVAVVRRDLPRQVVVVESSFAALVQVAVTDGIWLLADDVLIAFL